MKRRATYIPMSREKRSIVRRLAVLAVELDDEVRIRETMSEFDGGMGWNMSVAHELRRSAGTVRFVATLILQGNMSAARARLWLNATTSYLKLVRSADNEGIIR